MVIVVSGRPRSEANSDANKTGWILSGGDWYYRLSSGVNAHGWSKIKNADGKTRWYYFDAKGKMLTGWQTISDKKYYLEETGDLEGAMYASDASGAQSILTL